MLAGSKLLEIQKTLCPESHKPRIGVLSTHWNNTVQKKITHVIFVYVYTQVLNISTWQFTLITRKKIYEIFVHVLRR